MLRMNRPHEFNALNGELVAALHDEFDALMNDMETRVVILAGAGKAFCSGISLQGISDFGEGRWNLRKQATFSSLVRKIVALPQPVIGAVEGVAAGFGMSIMLACDVRY